MSEDRLLVQLRDNIEAVFADCARGSDVSPARRYRIEGFAEALISAGLLTEAAFSTLVADAYREAFGRPIPDHLLGGVRIPLVMQRAPVYPST